MDIQRLNNNQLIDLSKLIMDLADVRNRLGQLERLLDARRQEASGSMMPVDKLPGGGFAPVSQKESGGRGTGKPLARIFRSSRGQMIAQAAVAIARAMRRNL